MVAAPANTSYFNSVISVTEKYLGPASERFIRRQIEFHLQKTPDQLTIEDVKKLKDNVGVALGLLVDDKALVNQAVKEIDSISK